MTTLLTPKRTPTRADAARGVSARRLAQRTRLVDRALRQALPSPARVPRVIAEAMAYCVFPGGKRYRPLLCLGGCEAVGAPPRRALWPAAAIELIHTYSLVHDDLPAMDNADERRGQPSCHRKYGEANAILTGDALLTLAFELLGRDATPNAIEILHLLGRAGGTEGLIGGQVLDLQAISRPGSAGEQAWTDIARRKTAALIAASVVAGGLAGGASAGQLKALTRYGEHVGLAFQLMDDAHDRDGLAAVLGVEQARAQADRLVRRALERVEPFGRRGALLRALAEQLVVGR
jgi:geranylgeranyl diphosphate synthase type II